MKQKIKDYLRKILLYGADAKEGNAVIVYLLVLDKVVIDCFEELKKELNLKNIIYIEKNYKKIYELLKESNTDDDLKKHVRKIDIELDNSNTRIIDFYDNSYSKYEEYLWNDDDIYKKYSNIYKLDKLENENIHRLREECIRVLAGCATNSWATQLYKGQNKKNRLWEDLFKTIPDTEEGLKEYIEKMKYLKEYLNSLDIRTLYFNTDSGTDFEVGLSEYSKWSIGNFTDESYGWFNFPTYEIYTAPDTRFARGKIVVEKPSTYCGLVLKKGEIIFENGKVCSVLSDNKTWEEWILDEENKLNQIGEIALVSSDTPIAKLNKTFTNLLLDENTGCHLALGKSFDECISLPERSEKEEYYFSESYWHQDIVFGNESINVECKTSTGKKKVLMKNGIWKI